MPIPFFQINAFTEHFRGGNPAGVCLLEDWPADTLLQAIAAENGYSETAFAVKHADGWQLRWFTPGTEVDLCGHATLATAHALMAEHGHADGTVRFLTRSGPIDVTRSDDGYVLDMPSLPGTVTDCPPALHGYFRKPLTVRKADKYLLVYDDEAYVRGLQPDFDVFKGVDAVGVILTAPAAGPATDFVSRFFGGPETGVDEDPVTGSAHCMLTPYWSRVLGKTELLAEQASARGGRLLCRDRGERVLLTGRAVTYLAGELRL